MTTITSNPSQQIAHAHSVDLDACLDLINSEAYDDEVTEERIPTVDDAVAYFTLRGLAHEDALRAQAARDPGQWLSHLHRTRGALREIWDAEVEARPPGAEALRAVNEVLRHAPRVELVPGPGGVGLGHRHTRSDPTGEALARVIEPLVEAIARGDSVRFRTCANEGCRWAFEDTSRSGRRRWCDMSSCGNRAKVRRFRARHRHPDAQP